jgi:hypothetical protein
MAGRRKTSIPEITLTLPTLEHPVRRPQPGEILDRTDMVKAAHADEPAGGYECWTVDGEPTPWADVLELVQSGRGRIPAGQRQEFGEAVETFRRAAVPRIDTLTPVLLADDAARRAERTERARDVILRAQAALDARLGKAGVTPDVATGTLAPLLTAEDVAEILGDGSTADDVLKRAGRTGLPATVKTPGGPRFKVAPMARLFRVA